MESPNVVELVTVWFRQVKDKLKNFNEMDNVELGRCLRSLRARLKSYHELSLFSFGDSVELFVYIWRCYVTRIEDSVFFGKQSSSEEYPDYEVVKELVTIFSNSVALNRHAAGQILHYDESVFTNSKRLLSLSSIPAGVVAKVIRLLAVLCGQCPAAVTNLCWSYREIFSSTLGWLLVTDFPAHYYKFGVHLLRFAVELNNNQLLVYLEQAGLARVFATLYSLVELQLRVKISKTFILLVRANGPKEWIREIVGDVGFLPAFMDELTSDQCESKQLLEINRTLLHHLMIYDSEVRVELSKCGGIEYFLKICQQSDNSTSISENARFLSLFTTSAMGRLKLRQSNALDYLAWTFEQTTDCGLLEFLVHAFSRLVYDEQGSAVLFRRSNFRQKLLKCVQLCISKEISNRLELNGGGRAMDSHGEVNSGMWSSLLLVGNSDNNNDSGHCTMVSQLLKNVDEEEFFLQPSPALSPLSDTISYPTTPDDQCYYSDTPGTGDNLERSSDQPTDETIITVEQLSTHGLKEEELYLGKCTHNVQLLDDLKQLYASESGVGRNFDGSAAEAETRFNTDRMLKSSLELLSCAYYVGPYAFSLCSVAAWQALLAVAVLSDSVPKSLSCLMRSILSDRTLLDAYFCFHRDDQCPRCSTLCELGKTLLYVFGEDSETNFVSKSLIDFYSFGSDKLKLSAMLVVPYIRRRNKLLRKTWQRPDSLDLVCEAWLVNVDRPERLKVIFTSMSLLVKQLLLFVHPQSGRAVAASKEILSNRSQYFFAMFSNGNFVESKMSIVELDCLDYSVDAFEQFVHFLHGCSNCPKMDVDSLNRYFELLHLAVSRCCVDFVDFLHRQLGKFLDPTSVGDILTFALCHCHSNFVDPCLELLFKTHLNQDADRVVTVVRQVRSARLTDELAQAVRRYLEALLLNACS
ncbi:putative BTB/POZ domain protein [Trichinella spiralis]|uniref:putative BTB/POZ domain protein n=1 Tax=Trichinella spiralis TaxID=6334 RepID=UPI0001EFC257|nr:putative BTB/POZ domain protein [Trichinella spiralis]